MRNTWQFAAFLSSISAILFAGNLVVYEAIAALFGLNNPLSLLLLGIFLGIFSASFLIASILACFSYRPHVRAYYFLSAVWMGIFGHLFLFAVGYGLVVALASVFPVIPASALGWLFFAGAIAASIYGLLHARSIKTKQISVPLKNLPEAWEGKKLVVMSDLHLGPIHSSQFIAKVTAALKELSPDMLAIVGDLFDGVAMPEMESLLSPFAELSVPFGKYFVTGNHEGYGDEAGFLAAVESAGICTFRDELFSIGGIDMIGASYHGAARREDFQSFLARLPIREDIPSILFKHEPRDADIAAEAGISFQVSGHTHGGQFWPFGLIADATYKGLGYGLNYLRALAVYTSSGAGTWGPPLRVGTDSEIVAIEFIPAGRAP